METSARAWPEPPEGFEVACDRVPKDGCYGPFIDLAAGSPVYQSRSDERLVTIMVEDMNGSWVCEIDALDEHGEYAGTEACQAWCATPQEALRKAHEEILRDSGRRGKMPETENDSRPVPPEGHELIEYPDGRFGMELEVDGVSRRINLGAGLDRARDASTLYADAMRGGWRPAHWDDLTLDRTPDNQVAADTRVPGAVEAEVAETCLGVDLEDPRLLSNDALEALQDLMNRAVGIASDGNAYWKSDFVLDDETMAPYVERILDEDGSLRLADDAPQREVR